jgi:hypothetical protein
VSEILAIALHFSPLWAFVMAVAAALGWHLGTALWRRVGGIGRRR